MGIEILKEKYEALGKKVYNLEGEYSYLKKEFENNKDNIEGFILDVELHSKAIELLSQVQGVTRNRIKTEFETLVTFCLTFIFEQDYKFILTFNRRGNLQELDFQISKPGYDEAHDLLDTNGGGVIDIVSFALRLVLIETCQPKIQGTLIFDEPFSRLSSDYHEKAALLVKELSSKLSRQIIIISHEEIMKNHPEFNKIEVK